MYSSPGTGCSNLALAFAQPPALPRTAPVTRPPPTNLAGVAQEAAVPEQVQLRHIHVAQVRPAAPRKK